MDPKNETRTKRTKIKNCCFYLLSCKCTSFGLLSWLCLLKLASYWFLCDNKFWFNNIHDSWFLGVIKNCPKSFFLRGLNQSWWLQEASRKHTFFSRIKLDKTTTNYTDAARSSLFRFARLIHVIYSYCPAHAIFISLMSSVRQQRAWNDQIPTSLSIIFKTRISVEIVINIRKTSKSKVIDVRMISILRDKQI